MDSNGVGNRDFIQTGYVKYKLLCIIYCGYIYILYGGKERKKLFISQIHF